MNDNETRIEDLIGHTFVKGILNEAKDELRLFISQTEYFVFYHSQDCCEHVYLDDICGDMEDLMESQIIKAEVSTSDNFDPKDDKERYFDDEVLWTFYNLATVKGNVTLRWVGTSNGYYSVEVSLGRGSLFDDPV